MISLNLLMVFALQAAGVGYPSGVVAFGACPAENAQSHELAFGLASSDTYENARAMANMPLVATTDVRLLTDATDARLCQRMLAAIQQRVTALGATLQGTVIVYYKAGSGYIAVATVPWPETPTTPGTVRIRERWTAVYVFDPTLARMSPLAL